MELIGSCDVQYANNLFSEKGLVLRADRRNKYQSPRISFFRDDLNKVMIIKIFNDINIEKMQSNPGAGSKNRTDIHFDSIHLTQILDVLKDFVLSITEIQDDSPRKRYNPTGMEHAGGLSLGITEDVTNLPVNIKCVYGEAGFSITKSTKMFIDTERYPSKRYHLGFDMKNAIEENVSNKENSIFISIRYSDLRRFLFSIVNAQKKLS